MFKVIETLEQAIPLSQAGLLWWKSNTWDWRPDERGWWPTGTANSTWEYAKKLGQVYAILLEE